MNKRICIIASRLFQGGFTTSMVSMIKALQNRGYTIDLLLLDGKNSEMNSEVLNGVTLLPFSLIVASKLDFSRQHKIKDDLKMINWIKADNPSANKQSGDMRLTQLAIEVSVLNRMPKMDLSSYDCVISWEELTCNDFLAYNVKAKKKIGYIHPDYCIAGYDRELDCPVLKQLDYIVGVSEATVNTLKQVFPELSERIRYIPNITDIEEIERKANEPEETFVKSTFDIVTVCRLSIFTKGLDRLMRVAKQLNDDHLNYQWYIVGEGEGRTELEQMIEKDHLSNVHLVGGKDNPYPYMKKADLFVLLSNYEGRPMVVDEAKALHIPVLVTNYASAKEQVSQNNGWIVEMNDDDPYSILHSIITDPGRLEAKKHFDKVVGSSGAEDLIKLMETCQR